MAEVNKTLEPHTGWHRVCLNTIVRKGIELDSERLRILPMGSRVFVEEVNGRRVRITSPIAGWCSKKSSTDDVILEKTASVSTNDGGVTPSNRNQEAKLDRLKNSKAKEQDEELQKKLQQEIEDLQNVIKANKRAHEELQAELETTTAALKQEQTSNAQASMYRAGDVVQLPGGGGLGVVRYVGLIKDKGDSPLVGIQIEGDGGTDDASTLTDPNGNPVGWQSGPQGAVFHAPGDLKLLSGEKMLKQLIQLTQQRQMFSDAFDKMYGPEARQEFFSHMQ